MFCNQCGTQVFAGDRACPKCGKAVNWPATGLAPSRIERHLHTLAILWMVVGALFLIPSIALMIMGAWFMSLCLARSSSSEISGPCCYTCWVRVC